MFEKIKRAFTGESPSEVQEKPKDVEAKPPTLNELHSQAIQTRDALLNKIKPLRDREEILIQKIAPLDAELRQLREDIVKLEKSGLIEANKIVGALAPKVKVLRAEPGVISTKRENS